MSSYCLDRVLLIMSTCKFCRGCMIQFWGNSVTSGRNSGFCMTIMHRAIHPLLCSISLLGKPFLSSPNYCILWISFRVTFSCSLLWKWASRGHVSQPQWTLNLVQCPNTGRFQKKPSARASNNGRIKVARVCVRAHTCRHYVKHCYMSCYYNAIPFQELFDCHCICFICNSCKQNDKIPPRGISWIKLFHVTRRWIAKHVKCCF
jgi:hypothetical protein